MIDMKNDVLDVKLTFPNGEILELQLEGYSVDAIKPIEHKIENVLDRSTYAFYSIIGYTRSLKGSANE